MPEKILPIRERVLAAALDILYDLLYHQLAWSYDMVAAVVSLGRWQSWVNACLPYLNGPRILEIGFGPGHLQEEMDARGFQVFGLDASPQMVRQAHARLLHKGVESRLIHGYAQSLPFPSSNFDQVVATFPSKFIIDPQVLSDIYRILKPGGILLIIPYARLTGKHWYERILTGLIHSPQQSSDLGEWFAQPLTDIGFACSQTNIILDSSALLVIQAVKDSKI